jgi:hypothetical protein
VSAHRIIRVVALLVFAGACVLGYHRFRRTPEQADLTRFVVEDVPKLRASEDAIQERIARLSAVPGLKPDAARALLVDDVIPRLIRLRKQAEELPTPTDESKALLDEYLQVNDRLVDACRACVRVIDDPKVSTVDGLKQVRARFDEVRKAYDAWDLHVREACARHRLAPPVARPASAT